MRIRSATLVAAFVAASAFLTPGVAAAASPVPPSSYIWAQLPSTLPLMAPVTTEPDSAYVWAQLPASLPVRTWAGQQGSTYVWAQPPASIPTR
jgi:hypothetical protein